MQKAEKWAKRGGIAVCEIFTIITLIMLLADCEPDRLALAFGTLFLVLLPMLLEKLFHCRVCLPLYIFALAYAVGPMLGHCWNLYYTVPVWDKLLHICGGVMFAILGAYIFDRLVKEKVRPAARTIFALCFSITIAVVWEFCEFGADAFLGMDMQDDMFLTHLTSYLLGEDVGVTGSIKNIQSVVVNGITLPGYIDIGLVDSMLDMMLESLGALVTCLLILLDKGKHPLIQNQQVSQQIQ